MVTYKATYTLTRTDGKTQYFSKPFKSKKEAKEDLYDELERLEKDGVLDSLTYCNILEESEPKSQAITEAEFQDVLYHVFGHPYDEETGEVKEPKPIDLNTVEKKLDKLYRKRMKLDEKIEALREEVSAPKKGFTSTHKALSVDEALHRKTYEEHEDYAHLEVQAMLNHDGKKKPKKS